jgi:hypothetical protein
VAELEVGGDLEAVSVELNPGFVAEMLRPLGDEVVEVCLRSNGEAVTVTGEGRLGMLMPITG